MEYSNLLVGSASIIIILIIYYIFGYKKNKTLDQIIDEYSNERLLPNNITLALDQNKHRYLTAKYDGHTDKWSEEWDTVAYNVDGSIFSLEEHGQKTDTDTGFTLSGILEPFVCPEYFIWNGEECILKDLCTDKKEFKGLPYNYKVDNNQPTPKSQVYHEKLYISCPNSELLTCGEGKKWMGKESTTTTPCVSYDVCASHSNGFRHTFPISDTDVLDPTEFYICNQGKSEKNKCGEGLLFDQLNLQCNSPYCETGTKLPNDDTSYFSCQNGIYVKIVCEYGVDESKVSCANNICGDYPKIEYYDDIFGGIKSIQTCLNNVVSTISADSETVTKTWKSPEWKIDENNNKLSDPTVVLPKFALDDTGHQYERDLSAGYLFVSNENIPVSYRQIALDDGKIIGWGENGAYYNKDGTLFMNGLIPIPNDGSLVTQIYELARPLKLYGVLFGAYNSYANYEFKISKIDNDWIMQILHYAEVSQENKITKLPSFFDWYINSNVLPGIRMPAYYVGRMYIDDESNIRVISTSDFFGLDPPSDFTSITQPDYIINNTAILPKYVLPVQITILEQEGMFKLSDIDLMFVRGDPTEVNEDITFKSL